MPSDLDKIKKMADIINHQQKAIESAIGHFHVLYASQQFIFSTLMEAAPDMKRHFMAVLDQVLSPQTEMQDQYPDLYRHLKGLAHTLQSPAAPTPEQRRAQLYLAWPPKPT